MTEKTLLLMAVTSLLCIIAWGLTSTIIRLRRRHDPLWGRSFDFRVLTILQDLGGKSYAMPIQRRLNTTSKKEYSFAKIYASLDRLIRLNYIHSEVAELTVYDTVFRGSRRRMDYFLTDKGELYLAEHRPTHQVPAVFRPINNGNH